ncbi:hypothetical protein [Mycoplasma bradburyae]|uniref:Lipoprotein n=1 Tax=Mycoplasma bradburyae TaxID=2963128 RepID=A0ABT5GAT7_9MOLU|nr:hypothetical protein [Mycoplasma bradburyae]MDC4182097.1 hypothetical protein [Mycoplasma bradburyae]UTS69829.1 hypothetical protein NMG68_02265 [Mycoplasma bradburyae]
MKNKKSILKIITLLGVGSIVALSAASCNGIKLSEKSNHDSETNTNPKNESNNKITPSDNVSILINKARTELSNIIKTKENTINLYNDYSLIKKELTSAYESAEAIKNSEESTEKELNDAKDSLKASINKAQTDKKTFDLDNVDLLNSYIQLKTLVANKNNIVSSNIEYKYNGFKSIIKSHYVVAEIIINKGLQANGLTKQNIDNAKNNIDHILENIDYKNRMLMNIIMLRNSLS